jgi:hypothetical protein
MQVVIGIILVVVGFCMVYYANWLYNNIGAVAFFEKYLGGGGTRLGYKLIGMFVMFIGALTTFDLIDKFIFWVLAPVIKMMFPQ